MRPYFAIIKDSFREAIASRVLWILVGLIAFHLMLLAPLGIQLTLTTEFAPGDIREAPELIDKFRRASLSGEASPGKRVWSLIEADQRQKMAPLWTGKVEDNRDFFRAVDSLREGLNELVQRRDLYDGQSWDVPALPKEARDYLDRPRESLTVAELGRLNRLLIEASAPSNFARRSSQSIGLTYFFGFMDISGPLPFSKAQADRVIKEWIISATMSLVVGVLGVIAAILVTSTIVPQMFEPGSITLLLSKPISRSLLFLAKFFGACAFIFLNVGFLIGGLWLILGWRFGIWNQGMLLCIPIFLFLFLIYYAVSAFSGLIWKNPVISVVITVVFWASCFTVGTTKNIFEAVLLDQNRLTRVTPMNDGLIGVSEGGVLQLWDEEGQRWQEIDAPRDGGGVPTIDGPFYHAPTKQVIVGQGFRNPLGFAGQRITLRLGRASDGWQLRDGPTLPSGTSAVVILSDGTVVAVASDNIYRLRGQPAPAESQLKLFGVPILGGGGFTPALKAPSAFADPVAAAADPTQPRLIICSGNEVTLIARNSAGDFAVESTATLEGDEKEGAAVAMTSDLVVVAREDGRVWLLSPRGLTLRNELEIEPYSQPRFAAASPDGERVAILFHNRQLWLIDGRTGDARRAPVSGQGDISGFSFDSNNRLLVVDRVNRVIDYDSTNFARGQVHWQEMSRFERVYYYAILPLYTIFPKPGEIDNTVHFLLTGKQTTDVGLFQGDVTQQREDLHPWRPIVSGLAFVGLMLLISCIYLEWHEF